MLLKGAYCVCRVHNMLLKGAYCVGEHFVDPQGIKVMKLEFILKLKIKRND